MELSGTTHLAAGRTNQNLGRPRPSPGQLVFAASRNGVTHTVSRPASVLNSFSENTHNVNRKVDTDSFIWPLRRDLVFGICLLKSVQIER